MATWLYNEEAAGNYVLFAVSAEAVHLWAAVIASSSSSLSVKVSGSVC
jgi:hypothetical protein